MCMWPTGFVRRVGSCTLQAKDVDAARASHWLAFLVGMNLVFLPSVQNMLNADATGLAILLLLALGTFIAGVHMPSWKMCALGLVMACFVPAIACLEAATRIVLVSAIVWSVT